MLLALVSPVLAGLLVNEVVYDPSGDDNGFEWIELCNNGSTTVDLTGYQLHNAGSSWTEVYTFASGSIAPGEYLVVGYGSATHAGSFSPNLQNAGSETDGIRLQDASANVVDTVLYDDSNTNSLAEDDGTVATGGVAVATSGKSFGRFPDCADTNVSAADLVVYATDEITPGAANPDPEPGGGDTGTPVEDADCTGSADVKINEIRYATGEEYIELYNAGTGEVALEGWELAYGTSQSSTTEYALPAVALAPGAFFVVGSAGASYKDVEEDLSDMGNASNTDGVLLNCNATRVDSVLYADDNSGSGWTDDSGALATSFAEKPGSSESVARVADGVDTDVCAVDFAPDFPSPGYSNTAEPIGDADCTNADGITINEFVYATDVEWVELYNGGTGPVTLDAWTLQFGTSSDNLDAVELPDGTTLGVGEHLVIGSPGAAVKDIELAINLGNASNTDGVKVVCNYTTVDTVVYGTPNDGDAPWTDDTGEVATSLASKLGDGESLARTADGRDTDQCGVDFAVESSPTPGASNPEREPPVCLGGTDYTIKINEFVYDPEGTDSGNEWVELYNAGDTAVRLDGWVIEGAGTDWADKFTFPTGTEIQPGQYVVVGAESVADYADDGLSLDNASSGAGGLRILDCLDAAVIDTVLYGDNIEDPITGDGGSIEVVPATGEGASLGRYPNGEDTNAAADWVPYAEPTPGTANTDPGATGPDDDDDKRGCNEPPEPGERGCRTVLPFGGMEVGLAALALLRRRRSR